MCWLEACKSNWLWCIGDEYGDACAEDSDGDGYADVEDVCPEHKDIHSTDFRTFQTILLDPVGDSQIDPEWHIRNQVHILRSVSRFSVALIFFIWYSKFPYQNTSIDTRVLVTYFH